MGSLGVSFDLGTHDALIADRGTDVIWEKAVRCPCRPEDPFAGNINEGQDSVRMPYCPRCAGMTLLWVLPQNVRGLLTSINTQRNPHDSGNLQPGDASFGLGWDYDHMAEGDRITLLHPQSIDAGQVIVRNAAKLGNNIHLQVNLEENEDRLWYRAARAIYCIDDDGNTYEEGADFTLDGSKVIRWTGNSPRNELSYTLKYEGFLEYIVFVPPMERNDPQGDVGQKVLLKRSHVHDIQTRDRNRFAASLDDLRTIASIMS